MPTGAARPASSSRAVTSAKGRGGDQGPRRRRQGGGRDHRQHRMARKPPGAVFGEGRRVGRGSPRRDRRAGGGAMISRWDDGERLRIDLFTPPPPASAVPLPRFAGEVVEGPARPDPPPCGGDTGEGDLGRLLGGGGAPHDRPLSRFRRRHSRAFSPRAAPNWSTCR
jgi:hypothetical protein